jgi:hypothetical protein
VFRVKSLLPEEESKELQSLYRYLVKKLHPDINSNQTEKEILLWNRTQAAYEIGDLEELNTIKLLLEDIRKADNQVDSIAVLDKQIKSVDPKMLEILKAIQMGEKLPKPYGKEVFILKTYIAGTQYYEAKKLKDNIKEGNYLIFKREADNPHDKRAITIMDLDKKKLGYVPRAKNEIISNLMDAGKTIYGVIDKKEFSGDYLNLDIKVFLRDY